MSSRDVADTLLQLKGLVHVRAILEDRGASESELAAHTAEIERVRERLALLAREAEGLPAAAQASAPPVTGTGHGRCLSFTASASCAPAARAAAATAP